MLQEVQDWEVEGQQVGSQECAGPTELAGKQKEGEDFDEVGGATDAPQGAH